MGLKNVVRNVHGIDQVIEPILRAARVPGAAIAIVAGDETVLAKGYGYRDQDAAAPMSDSTVYPIASTTKAINATLLGMLVDEGRIAWDASVQTYLPSFRFQDPFISTQVTLRDLLIMRTGLPRHDWLWLENPVSRADIAAKLRYLDFSAPFRERFQYNNLTACTAGHIAEVVTGMSWEELVQERILDPLGMRSTFFSLPRAGDITLSYHENQKRELILTRRLTTEVAAPSGGAIHSTVVDMAKWALFNLRGGKKGDRTLIQPQTLLEIQSPQMPARTDPSCPSPHASYAMGWFVDNYNGHVRISHGGYLHDVSSEVMLFPQDDLAIVFYTNFGPAPVTRLVVQCTFDFLLGLTSVQTLEQKLAEYERRLEGNRQRIAAVRRVQNTMPSHSLDSYEGTYVHPGYGRIVVHSRRDGLELERNGLALALEHWHFDVWVVADNDVFEIHRPHAFDRASRIQFETDVDGQICAVMIELESSVPPIRFVRHQEATA